ncbi:MAG: L,D-transpeptidase [Solirubrobacterales bacterium]|nr:L,D-transpeptidase [Solirubrobacterales bacterium]
MRPPAVSAICGALLMALVLMALVLTAVGAIAPAGAAARALPGPPTRRAAWVARIVVPTPARTAPGGGRIRTVIRTSAVGDGGPVVLLVLAARTTPNGVTWLRVLLPQRPNGVSGWINSNFVEVSRTAWRIDVSLRARTVSLLRRGRILDAWPAVIGKPSTPTPPGLYAVYERVPQPSPDDFLGTWALLLTAFSPVLHNFDGGPGEVAIHGRGGTSLLDPLGSARSHGCIRIDNSAIDLLAADAAEGTPVQIN